MEEKSILDLQAAMGSGEISAQGLTAYYLSRIEQIDQNGPGLNAVIEVNPEALQIAKILDHDRKEGRRRGPLHGIPVLIKDNIDTADQMQTTAGSLALQGSIASKDAFIVEKLREAGAVILGKTNLSEWANFRSTRSTSGWSSRGGQTRNPYVLDRNPCGSSSGSGVAAAANLCAAAIGTETDGSIICPSSINGIVGLKPTLGLVSRSGIIPIAHSQDTAGPMVRTVTDAAVLMSALAGSDPDDQATENADAIRQPDYTTFLNPDGLSGARIGVARNFFGAHPDVDKVMEDAIDLMRAKGANIVDGTNLANLNDYRKTELDVLMYEFKHDLNRYLQRLNNGINISSLEEIIEFNNAHSTQVMPYFGQEIFLQAQEKGPLTDKAYIRALETNHRLARQEGIDYILQANQLDAIVAPSNAPSWLTDWVRGDFHSGGSSSPAAVAGYPNITVPAGYIHGLPVGISFFSTAYQEPVLFKLAYAFEQASNHRHPPQYLKKTLPVQ